MKKTLLYACTALVFSAVPASAQTFTGITPSNPTPINVKAADDFATRAFQDPWDMSQRTDVGWWTFGTDTAAAFNFQNPTVANGLFTGTNPGATASLFLLESGLQPTPGGSATPIGKTGQQYPIDANNFTHLVYRMNSSAAGVSQYVWSTGTIYDGQTLAVELAQSSTSVKQGWKIYDVNLPSLTPVAGPSTPWGGTIRSLQLLPNASASTAQIQLDWVRLVHDDPTLHQSVTWTTGGVADVYLDDDNNPANGTLGRVAVNQTSPFNLFVGALPAGRYFVALHAATTGEATATGFTYSTGSYQVNDIPTLQFTTPSDEGSTTDFATTRLGNPWDFTTTTDVDKTLPGFPGTENVTSEGITQLALRSEAGVDLGAPPVYLGTSAQASAASGNVGDPQVFTLFWDGKGKATRIDPARYRILTIDAGIPNKARSLPGGSIGRVVWRAANEPVIAANGVKVQTVGEHWAFNSAAGENTLARISIDMNQMPVEPHSADINTTWNSAVAAGGIDGFRFDPHEFSPATQFFLKRIKLAALERTVGNQLTFRWNYSKATGTVSLFRQLVPTAKNFTGGVQIVAGLSAAAGSYTWDATSTADGEYQVYAIFSDGTNNNQVYAPTNVVVDHSNVAVAQINLNRTQLNFAAFGPIRTGAQIIRLTFTGPGDQCWTTNSSVSGLTISPATGTGATAISISATGNFPGGTTDQIVTIQSCTNPSNARAIAVSVTGYNTTSAPIGSMDTPANGANVTGSVAVTGWAADDIEVAGVAICRDPVPASEATTPGQCGGQPRVFIGNAVFIDDARPDIETGNPTKPFNYRAGWGYLMLTLFLPNQGNGPFTLYAYAFDKEGRVSLLGARSIVGVNSTSTTPFGAIDTPQQGEVVCGTSYVNFGWALTQSPKDVPANSSTISVFIDNAFVGRPGTRAQRPDITAAFPTYNTTHAVGGFVFDTTQYANGVHSIFWVVTDTGNQTDGVGSRFFTISNPCGG
jgi:hypothetical protein